MLRIPNNNIWILAYARSCNPIQSHLNFCFVAYSPRRPQDLKMQNVILKCHLGKINNVGATGKCIFIFTVDVCCTLIINFEFKQEFSVFLLGDAICVSTSLYLYISWNSLVSSFLRSVGFFTYIKISLIFLYETSQEYL